MYELNVPEENPAEENPDTAEEETADTKQESFKWTHNSTLSLIELRLKKENEFNRPVCKKKKKFGLALPKKWKNLGTK